MGTALGLWEILYQNVLALELYISVCYGKLNWSCIAFVWSGVVDFGRGYGDGVVW